MKTLFTFSGCGHSIFDDLVERELLMTSLQYQAASKSDQKKTNPILKPLAVALTFVLAVNQHRVLAADENPVAARNEMTTGEAKADESMQLPEVRVTASPTSDTQGYVVPVVRSATKTDTPVLETPAAVQVIPKDVLEDRQIVSMQEAVKNVSGVQTKPFYYDMFMLRGFLTGSDIFRNGLKLFGNVGTETLFVDHIEIAKGPTAMLYGRVQPGGLVNVVTKAPQVKSAFSAQQQVGSWNTLRTTVDATGAVNDDKTVLYRVMGVFDKGDSFIDYQHHDNKALATYFAWQPSARFNANAQLEYYDQKSTSPSSFAQQMIPNIGNRPANVPRNWTQSDPVMWTNWPFIEKRTSAAFDWSYAFNDKWKLAHRLLYNSADEMQTFLKYQSFNAATNLLGRKITYNPTTRSQLSTNLDLTGEFKTGEIKHKVLLGLDWYTYDAVYMGYEEGGALNRVPALNIFAPVYGNINVGQMQAYFNQSASNVLSKHQWRDTGVYAQDQISFGQNWELLLGGRYDVARNTTSLIFGATSAACYPNCAGAGNPAFPTDRQFSPRAGLLYKLSGEVSLYGSYSESFGNTNSTAASFTNTPFKPEHGVQYELGAKASLLDGKVATSATLFDLRMQNRLTPDLAHPGFSLAVGEVQSRGFEFDMAGQITDHVSLIGSYTLNSAIITKDTTAGAANTVGKDWAGFGAGVPRHNASLWSKYDTAPGAAEGFTFGAGIYLNGQRQANNTNTVQLPGYGTLDAMIGYRTKAGKQKITAQLNVQNLTDKVYFDSSAGIYSTYGAPRNLTVSVKVDL